MSKKIPKRLMFLIMKEANKFSLKEANRIFLKKSLINPHFQISSLIGSHG